MALTHICIFHLERVQPGLTGQTLDFSVAHPAKSSPDPLTFQSLLDFFFFGGPSSDLTRPQLFLLPIVVTLVEFIFKPKPSDTFQTEERRQPSTFLLCIKVVRIPSLQVVRPEYLPCTTLRVVRGSSCVMACRVRNAESYFYNLNESLPRRLTVVLQR